MTIYCRGNANWDTCRMMTDRERDDKILETGNNNWFSDESDTKTDEIGVICPNPNCNGKNCCKAMIKGSDKK